jgi:PAS domain S-box-containing protein
MKKVVLILDASEENIFAYKKFLSKSDYKVYTSTSVEEAYNLFKISKPQILIVDADLPTYDGFEFVSELRKRNSELTFETIMISSKSDKEIYDRTLDYDVAKFLMKPFDAITLIKTINIAYNIFYIKQENLKNKTSLNESEILYKTLIDTSPDSIVISDLSGKIIMCNISAAVSHGLKSKEEFINRNIFDHVKDGTDKDVVREAFKVALTQGFAKNIFIVLKRIDGTTYIGEINLSVIKDDKGKAKYFISITRDVTDKIKKERRLSVNTRAMNFSDNSIIITDALLQGNPVVYVNPAFETVTGYSSDDIIGKTCAILHGPETSGEELKKIETAIQNRENIKIVIKNYKKNGEMFYNELRISPVFDSEGNLTNYIGVQNDITSRVKYEEMLKSSLKQKETLLKEIHHRIKNNLQIIYSLLGLQMHSFDMTGKNKKIYRKFKVKLEDARSRIKTISRIHQKLYQSMDFENINFKEFLTELVSTLIQTYSVNKQINYNIKMPDIYLSIDNAVSVGLIINEIISNSVKYAFENKQTGNISISFEDADGQYFINIKDNGLGVPDDINIDNPKSLGLRLIKGLTEQLNGTVTMIKDRGTIFEIQIPKLVKNNDTL